MAQFDRFEKPLKAFGFTVVVTGPRSIGDQLKFNHSEPSKVYAKMTLQFQWEFDNCFNSHYTNISTLYRMNVTFISYIFSYIWKDWAKNWLKPYEKPFETSTQPMECYFVNRSSWFFDNHVFLLRNESVLSTWKASLALDWLRLQTSSDHDLFSPCFIIAIILIYSHQNKP